MRVIVSAGGTGGHIYPAIAIINKIKEMEPDSDILYIGTHNRMEKDIVPSYDINFTSLKITGFKRKLTLGNFKTVYYFFKALKKAKRIMKDFKPDVVVGVGGYVTGPVIYTAHKLGIPTFIHEQNSIPGLANKFLNRYANKIGLSFESSDKYFTKEKTVFTGNPSSEMILKKKKIDKKLYGFHDDKKLILIVMGSLGAARVNEKIIKMLPLFNDKKYECLFVTGKDHFEELNKKAQLPNNVKMISYLDNMGGFLKNVDLIISRAGASMLGEILASGIPSILIPSPYVPNNHQVKNALDLKEKGASLVILEDELEEKKLLKMIDDILFDEKQYKKMVTASKKMGIKDSASRIYKVLKELVDKR
ncbi:MAG: undecaprenyldiphospho-muramoylpentapeptide beta-N-acetylglucosaminyltransferase [Bacilli bacterium]